MKWRAGVYGVVESSESDAQSFPKGRGLCGEMFSLLADPNGGRGRGALGLIVPLTLHDPGPEFGTGRGETDVVLGS